MFFHSVMSYVIETAFNSFVIQGIFRFLVLLSVETFGNAVSQLSGVEYRSILHFQDVIREFWEDDVLKEFGKM